MTCERDFVSPDVPRGTLEESDRGPLEPGLYLVATPIGNLEDITLRALRVLKTVDRIACEDTRFSQKLLNYFGISTTTISCHEHNEQSRVAELLEQVRQGGRVAVVSDAGMPGISDPGVLLVQAALEAGIRVIPVPGANAALTALVGSGLDTERFMFAGFLAAKSGTRRAQLTELAALVGEGEAMTLVFYEAPHRILETLADVELTWSAAVRVVVARELTKMHEEFLRGTAGEVRSQLTTRERIRGEIVLLVEARRPLESKNAASTVAERMEELVKAEGIEAKEALKRVARERGWSKSQAYRELQQEKKKGGRG